MILSSIELTEASSRRRIYLWWASEVLPWPSGMTALLLALRCSLPSLRREGSGVGLYWHSCRRRIYFNSQSIYLSWSSGMTTLLSARFALVCRLRGTECRERGRSYTPVCASNVAEPGLPIRLSIRTQCPEGGTLARSAQIGLWCSRPSFLTVMKEL